MPGPLPLFPPRWRQRYGQDFLEQFQADPRHLARWIDAVVAATALRWDEFKRHRDAAAATLFTAITLVTASDVALGVGLDERIDPELAQHWWGTPFVLALGVAAVLAALAVVAVLKTGRTRAAVIIVAALAAGSFVGSALAAAVSFDLAGTGAGTGFGIATAAARWRTHRPVDRTDLLLIAAIPMIVSMASRYTTTPAAPAALVIAAGLLLASHIEPTTRPA